MRTARHVTGIRTSGLVKHEGMDRRGKRPPAVVYRAFDGFGRLLYVGSSENWARRMQEHRYSTSWLAKIRRVELEAFPSIEAARNAEKLAIQAEAPLHNIEHSTVSHGPQASWTSREIALLEGIAQHGAEAVAMAVGRSVKAVRRQAEKRGVSLRRPDEERGRRMQPTRARVDPHAPLCPRCAMAPIEVEETGLCISCNRKELAARHERELAAKDAREAEAQRELDAARQRKHRALEATHDRA